MRASPTYPCNCILLPLLFLFYLETGATNVHDQSCSPSDLRALYAFARSLDRGIRDWPAANSTRCCGWPGVRCALFSLGAVRVVGLDLSGKGLEGVLSPSLAGLDKLSFLNLSSNSFRGSIPPELLRLKLLEVLDLSNNHLSGELPPGIGNLSNLSRLVVSSNAFTGNIPDVFHDLRKLEVLSAKSNGFIGRLPSSLSSCSMLTVLDLFNNSLGGRIDLDFRRFDRLTTLNLGWNSLHGLIPEALSSCKALKILNLSRNNLSGQVPEKLCRLRSLSFLNLDSNSLSNISQALGVLQGCHNLRVLGLASNFQGEEMPTTGIRGFQRLRAMNIGYCALTGRIPSWLRNCEELRVLGLPWNRLTGEIPSWFGRFDHLFLLDLANNSLYGEIPASLAELKSLTSEIPPQDGVDFSIEFPFFGWSSNQQILEPLKNQQMYKHYTDFPPAVILSYNRLNGSILKEFGNLRYLHRLDLSRNNLSGSIPEELSSMVNLERLDLSFNNLSGSIPSSLTGLSFLSFFSVAFNHIRGLIPIGGQFSTFPCSSFEGNPGLYSVSLPFCEPVKATYPKEGDVDEDKIAFIGLPFAIGVASGFVFIVYVLMCCWQL
ncbi:phytosulfokine receptor 1-like [Musa acuminata AAA Group]|uniref:phytosulfokine receptor 1-like n=1 Tax=Musa acuminata AAA Group TaxID=214697 RepID=UPI0031DFD2D3